MDSPLRPEPLREALLRIDSEESKAMAAIRQAVTGEDRVAVYRALDGLSEAIRDGAALSRSSVSAQENPDDLGAAWKEAEAALPEGWILALNGHKDGSAVAVARTTAPRNGKGDIGIAQRRAVYRGPFGGAATVDGPTPAAALRSLALRLSGNPDQESGG